MPRIRKSVQIDAPCQQVFAYATSIAGQPEWTTFVKEAQITSGDGKSKGTTDRSVIKVGLRARSLDHQWTEYRPPEAFARRATQEMSVRERMTFTPSDGGTRVEWIIDYRPPLGLLGRIANVIFMNRVFQNEIEASLENLKARMES